MRSQRVDAYAPKNFRRAARLRFLLPVVLLILFARQRAAADTLYSYSGSDFTLISSGDNLTTSDHVVISFTVPGSPLVCLTLCTVTPSTFNMGIDGFFSIFSPPNSSTIQIQTNSSGTIVAWGIFGLTTDDSIGSFTGGDDAVIGNGVAFSSAPGTWTITTVPEPATFATFGSGILALAGAFHRRRKRVSS